MTDATVLTLKYWGNSLGVRLPAAIARAARLQADQQVQVRVDEGRVVIEPLADEPLTLAQRLARFDPLVHTGEAMATGQSVGVEAW